LLPRPTPELQRENWSACRDKNGQEKESIHSGRKSAHESCSGDSCSNTKMDTKTTGEKEWDSATEGDKESRKPEDLIAPPARYGWYQIGCTGPWALMKGSSPITMSDHDVMYVVQHSAHSPCTQGLA
jgi:hypothetical protein